MKILIREILLSFWKIHLLHHAAEGPIYGQWAIEELRRHGYDISPGTLYPLLRRMERHGWLRCERDPKGGKNVRQPYVLTEEGNKILNLIRRQLKELYQEVIIEAEGDHESLNRGV
jgi:PadR family transcriptional regulator, regulatory protein PadR